MSHADLFNKEKYLCSCNHITIGDAVEFLKSHDIKSVQEWMDSEVQPVGDKCEACIEEGTENDGVTLAVILSQVKQGRL